MYVCVGDPTSRQERLAGYMYVHVHVAQTALSPTVHAMEKSTTLLPNKKCWQDNSNELFSQLAPKSVSLTSLDPRTSPSETTCVWVIMTSSEERLAGELEPALYPTVSVLAPTSPQSIPVTSFQPLHVNPRQRPLHQPRISPHLPPLASHRKNKLAEYLKQDFPNKLCLSVTKHTYPPSNPST